MRDNLSDDREWLERLFQEHKKRIESKGHGFVEKSADGKEMIYKTKTRGFIVHRAPIESLLGVDPNFLIRYRCELKQQGIDLVRKGDFYLLIYKGVARERIPIGELLFTQRILAEE